MPEHRRPIDPRIQRAADKYRDALDELQAAHDPLLKRALFEEACCRLDEAVVVTQAVEMERAIEPPAISNN